MPDGGRRSSRIPAGVANRRGSPPPGCSRPSRSSSRPPSSASCATRTCPPGGGRHLATTPASAFSTLIGQLFVTGLWIILLTLAYRSRPDLDTGDPAASLRGYRRAFVLIGRAGLTLAACIDLTLALKALRRWQIADLPGGLVILPVALGLAGLLAVVVHAGRIRGRAGTTAAGSDRDDDRFWKAGLVYVSHDDPALMVNARFGFALTPNLGNPRVWLIVGGVAAVLAGLIALKLTIGL